MAADRWRRAATVMLVLASSLLAACSGDAGGEAATPTTAIDGSITATELPAPLQEAMLSYVGSLASGDARGFWDVLSPGCHAVFGSFEAWFPYFEEGYGSLKGIGEMFEDDYDIAAIALDLEGTSATLEGGDRVLVRYRVVGAGGSVIAEGGDPILWVRTDGGWRTTACSFFGEQFVDAQDRPLADRSSVAATKGTG